MIDFRGILAANSNHAECHLTTVNRFVCDAVCGSVGIMEAVEEMPVSAQLTDIVPDFPEIRTFPLKFGVVECQQIEVKVIQKNHILSGTL